ncbi:uncharacterized protein LOC133905040 [Phragmites australis]|uniref:uncharacterized protein LOC133905040 n=1 Tax=Phragmites australis TaxID=29695 RepID=UPI002D7975A1|nr:uncharacterized protein LOC133905040 [Phragmites australis]
MREPGSRDHPLPHRWRHGRGRRAGRVPRRQRLDPYSPEQGRGAFTFANRTQGVARGAVAPAPLWQRRLAEWGRRRVWVLDGAGGGDGPGLVPLPRRLRKKAWRAALRTTSWRTWLRVAMSCSTGSTLPLRSWLRIERLSGAFFHLTSFARQVFVELLVAIREICKAIDVLVQNCGKKKLVDAINLPPPELYRHVEV